MIFSPFFHAIFWAGILAFIFYPFHKTILKLTRKRNTLSSVVSTLIVLIIMLPITSVFVSAIAVEGARIYDIASENFTVDKIREVVHYLKNIEPFNSILNLVSQHDELQQNLSAYILGVAKSIGNYVTNILAHATKNMLGIVIQIMLTIFLLFFFFLDGEVMLDAIKEVLPMEKKHKNAIFTKVSETLSAVIRGQFVTAFCQATLAGIMFWLLGLPIPLFFGFLTFISAMIPVTGAATVWFPFVVYLFSINAMSKAIALLLVGTFVISLIDNILRPYLIGSKTKLPILLLFLGILGGLKVYGLTGIFLGPVILALTFALIKIYQEEYMSVKNK
ncbi:MAG: AI-2E family transporter [Candidatus Omnitrophica bacterium]|nr:AI-2E family transporter [Candidatus Omnitrophota bacterium]